MWFFMTSNTNKEKGVYRKLAEHLDLLPSGFRPSETGEDIRLLKGLFTPQEAKNATNLTLKREEAPAIAKKSNFVMIFIEQLGYLPKTGERSNLTKLVLDMLLENKGQWMNLREIARRVNKNPGNISSVLPNLVERGLLENCKVGKVTYVYQMNWHNPKVQALIALKQSLKKD